MVVQRRLGGGQINEVICPLPEALRDEVTPEGINKCWAAVGSH